MAYRIAGIDVHKKKLAVVIAGGNVKSQPGYNRLENLSLLMLKCGVQGHQFPVIVR